ncbi:DinB family protein [Robiginitalea sp. SC105]|uniref:DinB family protein n=1 Tax=Robiginitalea sp. SC105 TaxID=2762332 RepID=UPI00163AE3A2|nr:DinB family protein [Robiginitalea sp. SC105]MBC2840626.1 DinB family protein [Robiginitalea sp. SC105]
MKRSELTSSDCPAYYQGYLNTLPPDADLLTMLGRQLGNFPEFIKSIPPDLWSYRYADGKWTLAESLGHVYDTERVFQYRALRFGRKDATPLPGFEQDEWIWASPAGKWSAERHLEEYQAVRQATLSLFRDFSREDLSWKGTASGKPMSLGAIGFIICGHQRHHRNIIRERYLDQ